MSKTTENILHLLMTTKESVKAISDKLNAKPHTIKWVAYTHGISLKGRSGIPRKRNAVLDKRDQELCELYLSNQESGITYDEIAAIFGVVAERVRQILSKQGIDGRVAVKARSEVWNKLCAKVVITYKRNPSLTMTRISKHFGMAHSTVTKILKVHGVREQETRKKRNTGNVP